MGSPFFQLSRAARNDSRANSTSTGPALFGPEPQPAMKAPAATITMKFTIGWLKRLSMIRSSLWLEFADNLAAVATAQGAPRRQINLILDKVHRAVPHEQIDA